MLIKSNALPIRMQTYPLAPAYHLLRTSSEDVTCQYSAT